MQPSPRTRFEQGAVAEGQRTEAGFFWGWQHVNFLCVLFGTAQKTFHLITCLTVALYPRGQRQQAIQRRHTTQEFKSLVGSPSSYCSRYDCEVVTSELTLRLLKQAKSRSSWKIFLVLDHVFLFPLKPWIDVKNAWRNYKGFLIFFSFLTTYIFQIFYNEYAICMIRKNIF